MPAEAVETIVDALRHADVAPVIGGGWGVDALLGEQARPDADLDLWLPAERFDDVVRVAVDIGLDRLYPWGDDRPRNFVLHDGDSLRVDLHLYESLGDGSLHYGSAIGGEKFPAEALRGSGQINNTMVRCESPEWARRCHTGYPLRSGPVRSGPVRSGPVRSVDYQDMRRLCERFDLESPSDYS